LTIVVPKPFRLGGATGGPPISRHVMTRSSFEFLDQSMWTTPLPERLPYLVEFVTSSWMTSAIDE